ncbi:class I SAM-dependent methyltransferase [uncultured Desulfobacter sp.]|uniref:class I SAM-dependent methyltransferase n=1 Tax=uncultured Desulfobacter sp. TaxID=240139 RepID=UPI0029F5A520|nr:class I SAM-dependent methyltransferase [uncultured Desulfobacter sp.]
MNSVNPLNCPICGFEKCDFKIEKKSFSVYRCRSCFVHFVYPQPVKADVFKIYDADYFKRGNKYSQLSVAQEIKREDVINELRWLRKIKKYKTSGKLLDCGCATGSFLYAAKQQGFEINGLEISNSAAQSASRLLNIHVENCELPQTRHSAESLDVVTLWDVIEHLQDPRAVLDKANSLLKPDGIIVFSTGDISSLWARFTGRYWQLLTPPQHLFFFNPKSIQLLLKLSGFELVEWHYLSKQVKVEFLIFKMMEAFGKLGNIAAVFYKISGSKRKYINLNLHDIITCVARKSKKK